MIAASVQDWDTDGDHSDTPSRLVHHLARVRDPRTNCSYGGLQKYLSTGHSERREKWKTVDQYHLALLLVKILALKLGEVDLQSV